MGSGGGGGGGGGNNPNEDARRNRDRAYREAEEQRQRDEQDRRDRVSEEQRRATERKAAEAKQAAIAKRNKERSEANRAKVLADKKIAAEKKAEVGVKYTPVSTPKGGVKTEASIMKTSPRSGELARKTGVSPSDVLATVGTLPTVDRDTAAANIAGRTDVNVATLGDLARRARVGNELSPIPTPGSVGLSTIGRASAMNLLTGLAKDQPTIGKDGKVEYSTSIVSDPRGGIGGTVTTKDGTTTYSGRPSLDPFADPQENKDDPAITPERTPEVIEDEVSAGGDSTIVGRSKRRTRGKRSGLAGKTDEYGILVTT